MGYCGERVIVESGETVKRAVSLRCRSWQCQECAPLRRKRLIAHAIAGKPDSFLTLTSINRQGRNKHDAAQELAHAWRWLRRKICTTYKIKKLPFLAVFEATQTGWPHLHILLRAKFIPQKWISDRMRERTGAFVISIARIRAPSQVVGYCAKYVGKDPHHFEKTKRYWSSQDYDQTTNPNEKGHAKWEAQTLSLYEWATHMRRSGWIVQQVSKWECVALRMIKQTHQQGQAP